MVRFAGRQMPTTNQKFPDLSQKNQKKKETPRSVNTTPRKGPTWSGAEDRPANRMTASARQCVEGCAAGVHNMAVATRRFTVGFSTLTQHRRSTDATPTQHRLNADSTPTQHRRNTDATPTQHRRGTATAPTQHRHNTDTTSTQH